MSQWIAGGMHTDQQQLTETEQLTETDGTSVQHRQTDQQQVTEAARRIFTVDDLDGDTKKDPLAVKIQLEILNDPDFDQFRMQ